MKKVLLIVVPIVVVLFGIILFFVFSGGHSEETAYEDTLKTFEEQAANDGQTVEMLDFDSTIITQNGRSYDLNGLIWIDFPSGDRQTHEYTMTVTYPPVGSPGFKWDMEEQ